MKLALFIHIVCVATWFGGIAVMAMVLRDALRGNEESRIREMLARIHRWQLTMFLPVSLLVLASGLYMLFNYTEKPLWLLIKERAGSLFIILFILAITLYGKKLLARANSGASVVTSTKKYIMLLNTGLLVMIALIFVVTFKF